MYEVGQRIYGIEVVDNDWEDAEVSGVLFMAECNDYIIGCAMRDGCTDMDEVLDDMYEESSEGFGVGVCLFKKEYCFESKEKAEGYLEKMMEEGAEE